MNAASRDHDLVGASDRDAVLVSQLFGQQLQQTRHAGRLQIVAAVLVDGAAHRRLYGVGCVEAHVPLVETEGVLDGVHHVADADDAREGNGVQELSHRAMLAGHSLQFAVHSSQFTVHGSTISAGRFMTLAAGERLGPYEIQSAVGAGGMGEVYSARDTRLDRTVAIKVLPASFAGDAEFKERFDREARTISQLDQPHICALYDVGDDRGTAYLVMQYLDGETLADRLSEGALPVQEALQIAVQIGAAREKAHRAGIIHRDLKPGNIMLTKAGAKLLDFGLARTAPVANGAAGASFVTREQPLTGAGAILGTLQYMAPEQLEGGEADARSDIFAFGGVLYEMLTGARAFDGKTPASVISSILKDTPQPIVERQPLMPPLLDHIVRRCLAKDPDERWQTAGDATRELKWISEGGGTPAGSVSPVTARQRLTRGGIAGVLAGLLGGALLACGRICAIDRNAPPTLTGSARA